jgi:phosphopantothenoylcysteine decarboxylase/phosphopantothenate--cysteine ligase
MSRKLLILSGPTHEYIDPVRFIGNASSGLMGKALAEEAHQRGYRIDFISGPVAEQNLPQHTQLHRVTSAAEMLNKAQERFASADLIIFAAAVADYTPAEKQTEKMAKSEENLTLRLKATADIAKTLCAHKRPQQTAIGFALQTADGEANARRKLQNKNLDGIVLNTPASLGASTGCFSFLAAGSDRFDVWGEVDKHECAKQILQQLETLSREK